MSSKSAAWLVGLVLLCGIASGCEGPKPFLLQGDAGSAEVGYSLDLAAATDVAKKHCAQFERVPRFLEAQDNVAYFDCVKP